jgi:Raf kinase inhibitor-like YbhB/YbcL family protein
MKLISSAFHHENFIPSKYTCDGDDISPPLSLEDVPEATKTFALIMDDPDAPMGIWNHWILFNIPSSIQKINEAEEPMGLGGKNSWGRTGYGGPCPPSGEHRYFFKMYALDIELTLSEGSTKEDLIAAMNGHIVGKAVLMGIYTRDQ